MEGNWGQVSMIMSTLFNVHTFSKTCSYTMPSLMNSGGVGGGNDSKKLISMSDCHGVKRRTVVIST